MTVHLTNGAHEKRADGMCAMEAASYIAGEHHSDKPECVSPVIATFMIGWNDGLPTDAERDRLLKPLLPLVLHTRTTKADELTRSWMAMDWVVRVHTPAWLDVAKLTGHATALRALPPLTCVEISRAAQGTIRAARDAAGDAARDAAGAAAGNAAWDAARDAAGAAAWAAAWAAAGDAAWDAAWDAARDAAGAAAGDAVAPTVTLLQETAAALVRRMCAVGEVTERPMRAERLVEVLGAPGGKEYDA